MAECWQAGWREERQLTPPTAAAVAVTLEETRVIPGLRQGYAGPLSLRAEAIRRDGEEKIAYVLDGAAACLEEVAVEGGEAGLEVGKVRVGAAAVWV